MQPTQDAEPHEDLPIPVYVPRIPDEVPVQSGVTIHLTGNTSLHMSSDTTPLGAATQQEVALLLSPEQWVVIGRQEGGYVPYLDPSYQSTQILPNTDCSIVGSSSPGYDRSVSRGHFTLKGSAQGIVLINGVPRRGGGIRPPMNGTLQLAPEHRSLLDGEELLIPRGQSIRIQLPNRAIVLLQAA